MFIISKLFRLIYIRVTSIAFTERRDLADSDTHFGSRMMKRRPGANSNGPFSDSDADSDKYAKSSKGSRKFLNFLSPMQWLSVLVILVALVGLWKYLETTSKHLESIHAAEKTENIKRIASGSVSAQ